MGNHQHLIEINGKKYDVATGKPLADPSSATLANNTGKVIDGFFKKPAHHQATSQPISVAKPKVVVTHQPTTPKIKPHTPAQHITHHKPQHSRTLMRQAVKKPTYEQAVHQLNINTSSARLERAQKVQKSKLISRFQSFNEHRAFVKKTEPVAVQKAPVHYAQVAHSHKPTDKLSTLNTHNNHTTTHNHISKSEQLFYKALTNATAHETAKHNAKKLHSSKFARKLSASRKIVQIAAGTLAVIILAGFFTYQNLPNLNLRLASARAGFSATMPGYKPDGFGVASGIEYGPGKVTINFVSHSDSRHYHITQRVSNWNSETLVENFLEAENKTYQTLEEKGKTIYLYDGSNATWVNGGVWYQIEGNSQLSNEQLVRIANSL